jgi:hypothetical protein
MPKKERKKQSGKYSKRKTPCTVLYKKCVSGMSDVDERVNSAEGSN